MFLSVSNHDNENLIKNRLNTKHVYPASKHVTYGKILISTITIIIGNQWQPFIKIKKNSILPGNLKTLVRGQV